MNHTIDENLLSETLPNWTMEVHRELPSTNQYLMRRAAEMKSPALVVAETQTQGRGRGGNRWWSQDGSLTFSLLVSLAQYGFPRSEQRLLSLITAALVRETILSNVDIDGSRVQLKWPNDIYLDGKKVCGILLEQPGVPGDLTVIGIGLNVNNSFAEAPAEIREKAISIQQAATEIIEPTTALLSILMNFEKLFADIQQKEKYFPSVWNDYHLLDQKMVTIDLSGRQSTGRCEGIDESGALLLRDMYGLHQIHSAVVLDWE